MGRPAGHGQAETEDSLGRHSDMHVGRFAGDREVPAQAHAASGRRPAVSVRAGGIRLTDTHNGLRALSAHAARQLPITQNRMAHASELLHNIVDRKLRYVEVPVTIRYTEWSRAKGQSVFNAVNILFDLAVRRLLSR